jgi:hypothetical protein
MQGDVWFQLRKLLRYWRLDFSYSLNPVYQIKDTLHGSGSKVVKCVALGVNDAEQGDVVVSHSLSISHQIMGHCPVLTAPPVRGDESLPQERILRRSREPASSYPSIGRLRTRRSRCAGPVPGATGHHRRRVELQPARDGRDLTAASREEERVPARDRQLGRRRSCQCTGDGGHWGTV